MDEQLLKAKIPCKETGIEIRHTMCDICTPGLQCGVDAYVKDDVMIKLEGTKGFPSNNGKLCAKGAAGREYQYRADRLTRPLKRIGERGSGQFEPVSWDEALDICAEKFLKIKEQYGPEAVAWVCGYSKWLRPWLHRLTHSFGSLNFITESSSCHCSEVMSYSTIFGQFMRPHVQGAKLVIAWGVNGFANNFAMAKGLMMLKEHGGKIIVIDPRYTHTSEKLADLVLRPKIGTDGYLANAMANYIIQNHETDDAFIEQYVHGFEEYKEMVSHYTLELAAEKTGIDIDTIVQVAEMFAKEPKALIQPGNGLTHHLDGYNMHRAILSLMVITGRIDRPGGYFPAAETFCHSPGGFPGREEEFINSVKPKHCKKPVGFTRFPLWFDFINEAQGMDLVRQIRTAEPYPVKAMAAFGVNHKMYPDSEAFLEVLNELDFIMATEIFHTTLCDYADIVLPVKTSYERSEAKCYANKFVFWTRPAIPPIGDCKDDVEVITELAKRMHLNDTLLEAGYDEGVKYIFDGSGIEDWEAVKDAPLPVPAPNAKGAEPGSYLASGKRTPSGKIELYSETVAKYQDRGLNPLPVCADQDGGTDPGSYPFVLMTGARIATAIHSRTTGLSWLRSQTKEPVLKINPEDAEELQLKEGSMVRVSTKTGSLVLPVHITAEFNCKEAGLYHGFDEANANSILAAALLDPYSGFPAYKQFRCRIEKEGGAQ